MNGIDELADEYWRHYLATRPTEAHLLGQYDDTASFGLVSPGQACSYMVGRVEIQRIGAEAEERQGDGFDVKQFHSAVLDSGSLPLEVLDEVVLRRLP